LTVVRRYHCLVNVRCSAYRHRATGRALGTSGRLRFGAHFIRVPARLRAPFHGPDTPDGCRAGLVGLDYAARLNRRRRPLLQRAKRIRTLYGRRWDTVVTRAAGLSSLRLFHAFSAFSHPPHHLACRLPSAGSFLFSLLFYHLVCATTYVTISALRFLRH